jgi:hypothetical protein
VKRREMKIERKYSRTLSKGSRPETEYSEPQLRSNPSMSIIDSNNTNLNSSIDADKSGIDCKTSESYSYCETCAWNGYPYEKVVLENFRIRPEDEDGFIYEFDIFNYDTNRNNRTLHKHKFDRELIDFQVNAILNQQESIQQE